MALSLVPATSSCSCRLLSLSLWASLLRVFISVSGPFGVLLLCLSLLRCEFVWRASLPFSPRAVLCRCFLFVGSSVVVHCSPLPLCLPSILLVPLLRSFPWVSGVCSLLLAQCPWCLRPCSLWCGSTWFLIVFLPRSDLRFPSQHSLPLVRVRVCWFFCLAQGLEFHFRAGLSLLVFVSVGFLFLTHSHLRFP